MTELRHVAFSEMNLDHREFAVWLASLPGRLLTVMPWPSNTRYWVAVSVEDR